MIQIGNYPLQYDLSLLQTIYHRPNRSKNSYTDIPDSMDLVIKDNVTGEKFIETIENPEYTWYRIKNEVFVDYNLAFIEKEKCDEITVPYRKLLKSIAEATGNETFFDNNAENGDYRNNQRLHEHVRVMGSDMNIEDFYRFQFGESYKNAFGPINKSYLDIEVDSRTAKGDFVEPGECPINAVTFIDDRTQTVFTLLLRDPYNPLCLEFEKLLNSGKFEDIAKDFIIKSVGGPEKAKKYRVDTLQFSTVMYTDEKELIKTLFNVINKLEPDFLLAWNMAFDIPYIIERCKKLDMDPKRVMCHPDFKYKEVSYFIDDKNFNEFAERNDFCKISSKTVYIDQLIHFASRRKGRSAIPNFRLDSIAEMTVGFGKLDYHHICEKLEDLPQKDYLTFVLYNIMDVISQYCIENKVNDVGNAYNNVLLNNTRISKIYRQTVYLKNRAFKSYWRQGFIMGNNNNKNNTKTKFPGAWVSDPTKLGPYSKMIVNGKPIMVFRNLNDYDYKSLYPSITSELNLAANTIIARIVIPDQVYKNENRFAREDYKYKREGQFLEDYQSHQWLEFYHRWFHLASYEEMYDDVITYFSDIVHPRGKLDLHCTEGRYLFYKVPNSTTQTSPFVPEWEQKMMDERTEYPHKQFPFSDEVRTFSEFYNKIESREENCYSREVVEV